MVSTGFVVLVSDVDHPAQEGLVVLRVVVSLDLRRVVLLHVGRVVLGFDV